MCKELGRIDVLLRIITSAEGDPLSPVQLQKVAFLIGEECRDYVPPDYYEFVAYDYGPFCADIYKDTEKLQQEGLITIDLNSEGRWKEYRAAFRSRNHDASLIPPPLADYINRVVDWAMSLSFRELVSTIYHLYPDYARNSIFRG